MQAIVFRWRMPRFLIIPSPNFVNLFSLTGPYSVFSLKTISYWLFIHFPFRSLGTIQFKSYEEGKVNLVLQGSCSGCPSSMITLKAGIEGMMKRMIPEVKEVVAEAE